MSFLAPSPPPPGPIVIKVKPHGKKFKCRFLFHAKTITKIMTSEQVNALTTDDKYKVMT